MGGGVSKMAKQELVATIRDRYRQSSKKDKGRILDEFAAITGHHRKHGIRLLSGDCRQSGQAGGGKVHPTTRPYAKRSSWSGRLLTASAVNGSRRHCPTSWTLWSGMGISVSIPCREGTSPLSQRRNPGPAAQTHQAHGRQSADGAREGHTWEARSRCAPTTTRIGRLPAFWKSTW